MITIRQATMSELEKWWDDKIKSEPDAKQHKYFKDRFITKNQSGEYKTFYAWDSGKFIGQATLIFKGNSAEINRLEVVPEYRGKGMSTQIFKYTEDYAKKKGIDTLSIGVEPFEVRNMQIYFHWGFTDFVRIALDRIEGVETNNYLVYSKKL